jgi:hypothetical protein
MLPRREALPHQGLHACYRSTAWDSLRDRGICIFLSRFFARVCSTCPGASNDVCRCQADSENNLAEPIATGSEFHERNSEFVNTKQEIAHKYFDDFPSLKFCFVTLIPHLPQAMSHRQTRGCVKAMTSPLGSRSSPADADRGRAEGWTERPPDLGSAVVVGDEEIAAAEIRPVGPWDRSVDVVGSAQGSWELWRT